MANKIIYKIICFFFVFFLCGYVNCTKLRASANTWKEFGQPMPKPMYHGIWSASFLKDLKIEGNHLILMKNLRNFTVQFELLRKTGVPV